MAEQSTQTYERFTDRARKVMQLANQEAQRLNHEYISTEHVLLGLVKGGNGAAAYVLKNLDVDLRKIRLEVEKLIQSGPDMVTMGRLPQTSLAKKVIEYSMEESRNLNHHYVGTEHILLGLLREQEGVAAQVLMNLGLKLEDVLNEVLKLLTPTNKKRKLKPEDLAEVSDWSSSMSVIHGSLKHVDGSDLPGRRFKVLAIGGEYPTHDQDNPDRKRNDTMLIELCDTIRILFIQQEYCRVVTHTV